MRRAVGIVDLDGAGLDARLADRDLPPLLLDLSAPWCAPCLAMTPTLERLAGAAANILCVAKLDVDQHPETSKRLGVRAIPCLVLFKQGAEVSRRTGLQSREQLACWLSDQGLGVPGFNSPNAAAAGNATPSRSFYGVHALRDRLVQRAQQMADAGQLQLSRLPSWSEEAATLSAALVGSAQPGVFEHITGMPYAFACALELTGARSPEEVAELLAAIPVDADLRHVPTQFLVRWLDDENLPWPGALDDAATDALRRSWSQACRQAMAGAVVAPQVWAALRARAAELVSKEPSRTVQSHFGRMLEMLSPPPPAEDDAAWYSAMLIYGGYIKSVLARYLLGWRQDDFGVETLRLHWLEAYAPAPHALSAEQLQAWRDRYLAANAAIEARYAPLAAHYYERHQEHLHPINLRLRTHLLQLLQCWQSKDSD